MAIRKNISLAQQIVQASHAALGAGFEFPAPEATCSIVLLEVANEKELLELAGKINDNDIKLHVFYEPDDDLGYQPSYTALATEPLFDEHREIFSKYKMWKMNNKS